MNSAERRGQDDLGRLIEFDERSRSFPIRATWPPGKQPRSYTWSCAFHLDQGSTSSCVGHAWAHEVAARPAVDSVDSALAMRLYHRAQQLDPWPGAEPDYYGTSILAGAKATQEEGRIGEYRWAFGLLDLILAVGYRGPAVVGVNWYEGMFFPDRDSVISPTGRLAGGHAILVNGVSVTKDLFRIHNSWGSNWGTGGDAFITFDDMDRLLHEDGEACIPVQRIRSW